MKLNYQNAYEVVEEALLDDLTWYLAVAFTQKEESEIVKSIVAEQYQQASEGVDDFDMTVEQYLFAMLDEEEVYMKKDDYFDSEEEAEKQGFYWFDGIHRWLKLDVWR